MEREKVRELLNRVQSKSVSVGDALEALAHMPYADLGFAKFDHHRALRCGFAEVVFAEHKTAAEIIGIMERGLHSVPCMLATRVQAQQAVVIKKRFPKAIHNARARTVRIGTPAALNNSAAVAVVAAGTSDLPVAEEAIETLRAFGCKAESYYDIGVAGLHRLLDKLPHLRSAAAIIAVAGMEGALPSVVGGLVACPVIAVPTSIGYGSSFGGIAALLAMLNSCASGVSVVNIDNGFGAAMCALRIIKGSEQSSSTKAHNGRVKSKRHS
jgi:NCAIR mutase (PurE)-related protein